MKQTLAVKLAPSSEQRAALLATLERFNAACDWIAAVAFRERCANKVALQKLVYYAVRAQFELSAQLTIRAIAKAIEAYKSDKATQPHFRPHGAMPYDDRLMSWKGVDRVSLLALTGRVIVPVRLGNYQTARRNQVRGQADLIYRDGTFFLYCTLEVPEPIAMEANNYLGIDLGIVNLAADSDGRRYSGAAVEHHRRIYAHRRRNLQRKGTHAARRKLKSLRRMQARYQADTNHVVSKAVVAVAKDTARGIALEALGGLRERVSVHRRQRARHANWAFAQLRRFIEYKARGAGVPVVAVDPRNTSRTCPACGIVDKASRRSQAEFSCTSCGYAGLADVIAARVIATRARAAVMQPMVPDAEESAPVAPGTSRLL
jgi:putative transposase